MLTGSAARKRSGNAASAVEASAPPAVLMRKSLRRCRCCDVRPRPFFIVTSHGVKARALRREPRQKLFRQATFALVPPLATGRRQIVYKIICKIANSRVLPYSRTPRQLARRRRSDRREISEFRHDRAQDTAKKAGAARRHGAGETTLA